MEYFVCFPQCLLWKVCSLYKECVLLCAVCYPNMLRMFYKSVLSRAILFAVVAPPTVLAESCISNQTTVHWGTHDEAYLPKKSHIADRLYTSTFSPLEMVPKTCIWGDLVTISVIGCPQTADLKLVLEFERQTNLLGDGTLSPCIRCLLWDCGMQ